MKNKILINNFLVKNCLILTLIFFWSSASANFIKMQLLGVNDCNGQLEVAINVKSSIYSPNPTFQIGSATIAINFDPDIVNYSSYTPEEFSANSSQTAALANWQDQEINVTNHFGLIGLVLHKELGGTGNYTLYPTTWIKVGTLHFDFIGVESDPGIIINQYLTLFNRSTNDEQIELEDYPDAQEWECCTYPVAAAVVDQQACNGSANGSIEFQFTNNPTRTHIEFSIDGGATYPYNYPDNSGLQSISNLSAGFYDIWVRWGDNSCQKQLPLITIDDLLYPTATATTNNCGGITLGFPDHPDQNTIKFSIDGGTTYPYAFDDNWQQATIGGLANGTYDLWTAWDNDACPVDISDVTVTNQHAPPTATVNVATAACNAGMLNFSFVDLPNRSTIEFSIDNGNSYFALKDDLGSYTKYLQGGTYDIWVRWGDGSCPAFLGRYIINNHGAPVASASLVSNTCLGHATGSIKFDFENHPSRTGIHFSIDGGLSYPYQYQDKWLTQTVDNLPAGMYNAWVRWGSGHCALDLGAIFIKNNTPPAATISVANGNCEGVITFNFNDTQDRSSIGLSIDGGLTYTVVPDNSGSFIFNNLTSGTYNCKVRWGNEECPVDVQTVTLNGAPPVTVTKGTGVCKSNYIKFQFPDTQYRSTLSLSIDGGATFVHVNDNIGSYTFHPSGTAFHVVYKWGNGDCETYYGLVNFNETSNAPVGSASLAQQVCPSSPNSGQIQFHFENHPGRTGIEFSIDGGHSYPYLFPYAALTGYTNPNLAVGTYDIWVRWGNNACPVDLQDVTISAYQVQMANVMQCSGSLIFTYPDNPNQSTIEFSLDGGNSFPYSSPDHTGQFVVDGLNAGVYDVWFSWGTSGCPTPLSQVVLNLETEDLCTGFENFDAYYFGVFNQDTSDDMDWIVDSDGTPSNYTGPSSAIEGENYIYLEATNNFNKKGVLSTNCFTLSQFTNPQLSFYYHMYGDNMGTLKIELYDALDGTQLATVFSQVGDQGNQWHNYNVDLSPWSGEVVYLLITGITGFSNKSDMALDDFCISSDLPISCNQVDSIGFENETSLFWNLQPTSNSLEFQSSLFSSSGVGSWMLKGNNGQASSLTSFSNDYSQLTSFELSFDFKVASLNSTDQLWIEISLDDGLTFIPLDVLELGVDFENDFQAIYSTSLLIDNWNFSNQTQLRIRSVTATANDYFFLDNVVVTACGPSTNLGNLRSTVEKVITQKVYHEINVYPNPASKNDLISVETDLKDFVSASIIDINGKLVRELAFKEELIQLKVNNFQSGVYMIVLETKSGIHSRKFIVLE